MKALMTGCSKELRCMKIPEGYRVVKKGQIHSSGYLYWDSITEKFRSYASLSEDYFSGKYGQDPFPSSYVQDYICVIKRK